MAAGDELGYRLVIDPRTGEPTYIVEEQAGPQQEAVLLPGQWAAVLHWLERGKRYGWSVTAEFIAAVRHAAEQDGRRGRGGG